MTNKVPEEELLEVLRKQRAILDRLIAATEEAAKCKKNINALVEARENVVDAYAAYQRPRHAMVDAFSEMKDNQENVSDGFYNYVYSGCEDLSSRATRKGRK